MKRQLKYLVALGVASALCVGLAVAASHVGISVDITAGGASDPTHTASISVGPSGPGALGSALFPGGSGDATIRVTNPDSRAVTITGLLVPSPSHYAPGFATPALVGARAGCSSANSGVTWQGAAPKGGTPDPLISPLVVAAHSALVVTLTNVAFMQLTAPSSCEGAYFAMPAPTAVTASESGGAPTHSPTTDALAPPCPGPPDPPPPPGPRPNGCPPGPGGPDGGGPPPGQPPG
jgi:hypothetical protein